MKTVSLIMKALYSTVYVLLIGLLFLSFGCVNSNKDTTEKEVKKQHKTNVKSEGNIKDEPEDFFIFLDKFNHNEIFQMRRIKFPLPVVVPNMDDTAMRPMEDTITKYEWEIIDLSYDSTFLTREYDQYYQISYISNDTATLELRGVNNGIYIDYIFTLLENKWYLVSFKDASL